MTKLPDSVDLLDLERDLPTTTEDIEALRINRPTWPAGDLRDVNRLQTPIPSQEQLLARPTFAGYPPFEL